MLIAFEGGEGCGKGIQIRILAKRLRKLGYKVLIIPEPGGTKLGKAIRRLLLNRNDLNISPLTEVFLFTASRAQQVFEVTQKALRQGYIVLSDRSFYSMYAYQGYGRGVDLNTLITVTDVAVKNIKPSHVLLLDVPPSIGIARKRSQMEINRLDKESLKFHKKVRSGFLTLTKTDPTVWSVINAKRTIEDVSSEVWRIVSALLDV